MTAEEYLDRIKKIDAMIKNKQREHWRWEEVADGMGGASDGERVQASRNLHRSADAIGNYIDLEREIDALKQERQTIIRTIEQLPSIEYDVIHKLYIGVYNRERDIYKVYTRKEVAYIYGKSLDWVKERKRKGLMLIQTMLDAQTSTERG